MPRTFNTVTVLGTGVLGSQIIMQAAWHGKNVYAYDAHQAAIDNIAKRWELLRRGYQRDLPDYTDEKFAAAIARITPTTDLEQAVSDTDIVIEAVPENLELKREVWANVGALVDERTLLATNTSSLRPSDFADSTGHPERFVTIHYANRIWAHPIAEVMGTAASDPEAIQDAIRYAKETGMVPVHVRKETPGYLLNSLLIPWMDAAAELLVNGVATPEEVDKAWRISLGTGLGPFQIYDIIGFNVAVNISRNSGDPAKIKFAEMLEAAIAQGHSGIADGQGFYRYDAEGRNLGPVEAWNQLS